MRERWVRESWKIGVGLSWKFVWEGRKSRMLPGKSMWEGRKARMLLFEQHRAFRPSHSRSGRSHALAFSANPANRTPVPMRIVRRRRRPRHAPFVLCLAASVSLGRRRGIGAAVGWIVVATLREKATFDRFDALAGGGESGADIAKIEGGIDADTEAFAQDSLFAFGQTGKEVLQFLLEVVAHRRCSKKVSARMEVRNRRPEIALRVPSRCGQAPKRCGAEGCGRAGRLGEMPKVLWESQKTLGMPRVLWKSEKTLWDAEGFVGGPENSGEAEGFVGGPEGPMLLC